MLTVVRLLVLNVLRHPLPGLFNLAGVALGVAVFLAVSLANRSATDAFHATIDIVAGKANLEVRDDSGGLDEGYFHAIADHPEVAAASPIVEGYATLPDHPGEYLHLLGIDVFSNAPLQTGGFNQQLISNPDLTPWIANPRQVILPAPLASKLGIASGDTLTAMVNSQAVELTLAGTYATENETRSSASQIALMDIGWAQEMLGRAGKLTSVQVLLKNTSDTAASSERIHAQLDLPASALVTTPASRSATVEKMAQGFQLNLNALAMVSSLAGAFIIFNTISASVVRRKREIGTLRAIGSSTTQIRWLFLGEGLLYGILGTAMGLWIGDWLAGLLVGDVASTISSRYMLSKVSDVSKDWLTYAPAAAVGIGSAFLAAWSPAQRAVKMDPAALLVPGRQQDLPRTGIRAWLITGIVLLALAVIFAWWALQPTGPAVLALAACLCLQLGAACLSPWLIQLWTRAIAKLTTKRLPLVSLANNDLAQSSGTVAVAVSASAVTLAMLVGLGVMVHSFRTTVSDWVGGTLKEDIYIAPAENEVLGTRAFLPNEAVTQLRDLPGITTFATYRETAVVPRERTSSPVTLTAVDPAIVETLAIKSRSNNELPIAQQFANFSDDAGAAIITEPMSLKTGYQLGEMLTIPTPSGDKPLRIIAIVTDYSDERGRFYIPADAFSQWWQDDRINSVGISFEPDKIPSPDALITQLSATGEFAIYTNAKLRGRVMQIFDQTFAITNILRVIAIIVAVLGIILSLTVLVLERSREIATLRAVGGSKPQIIAIYSLVAVAMAMIFTLLGISCGFLLAMMLTEVVNPAFFGWTIPIRVDWLDIAFIPLWTILVAALAGVFPAFHATSRPVSESLRSE